MAEIRRNWDWLATAADAMRAAYPDYDLVEVTEQQFLTLTNQRERWEGVAARPGRRANGPRLMAVLR